MLNLLRCIDFTRCYPGINCLPGYADSLCSLSRRVGSAFHLYQSSARIDTVSSNLLKCIHMPDVNKNREWQKKYRDTHREQINSRWRARTLRGRVVALVPDDPIIATKAGICLICGSHFPRLYLHLKFHKVSSAEYRANWRLPDALPLLADDLRAKIAESRKYLAQTRRGKQLRTRTSKRLKGVPRPELLGKTGPNPSGVRIADWQIACDVASGKGQSASAKDYGIEVGTVQQRAQRMGLNFSTKITSDQGLPLRHGAMNAVRQALGLSRDRTKKLGLSFLSHSVPESRIVSNSKLARKFIRWRNDLASKALHIRHTRQERILKTLFPKISELNDALIETFSELRSGIRSESGWTVEKFGEAVCALSYKDTHSKRHYFRRALLFLCEAKEHLEPVVLSLAGDENVGPISHRLLAATHGNVTPHAIQRALIRARALRPKELWNVITTFAPDAIYPHAAISAQTISTTSTPVSITAPKRKRPGRHAKPEKTRVFVIWREVEDEIPEFEKMIQFRKSLGKKLRENPKRLRAELAKAGVSKERVEYANCRSAKIAARKLVAAKHPEIEEYMVARYHARGRQPNFTPTKN